MHFYHLASTECLMKILDLSIFNYENIGVYYYQEHDVFNKAKAALEIKELITFINDRLTRNCYQLPPYHTQESHDAIIKNIHEYIKTIDDSECNRECAESGENVFESIVDDAILNEYIIQSLKDLENRFKETLTKYVQSQEDNKQRLEEYERKNNEEI